MMPNVRAGDFAGKDSFHGVCGGISLEGRFFRFGCLGADAVLTSDKCPGALTGSKCARLEYANLT
jgi:hypothetical protein